MSSNIDKILRDLDSKNPVEERAKLQNETNLSGGQANAGPARVIVLAIAIALIAAAAGAMFFFVS